MAIVLLLSWVRIGLRRRRRAATRPWSSHGYGFQWEGASTKHGQPVGRSIRHGSFRRVATVFLTGTRAAECNSRVHETGGIPNGSRRTFRGVVGQSRSQLQPKSAAMQAGQATLRGR